MSIQLSPESEATIRELVERGGYEDEETVVAEALRVLVERDKLERLRALIAVGDEQAARGQLVPWTPDFMDRLKREAAEDERLGRPLRDEVLP
jgi:putative addiction module CopG family antidote